MSITDKKTSCCTAVRDKTKDHPQEAISTQATAEAITDHRYLLDHQIPLHIAEIEGGTALIGTDTPFLAADEEAPLRRSKIKRFWMDATTVTNARFAQFVEATGYVTEAERYGDSFVFHGLLPEDDFFDKAVVAAPWWRAVEGACWYNPTGTRYPSRAKADHPVIHISWHDAMAFAKWAGGRLPNEAEWEHGARGGQGDVIFAWGNEEPDDSTQIFCNIWQGSFPDNNTTVDGHFGTAPVTAFSPNPYGLYQMCGNVWEWTSQAFKTRSMSKRARSLHRDKTGHKITKGGSFLCHKSYCYRYRIAARSSNSPESTTSHQGFRLVYDRKP